VHLAAIVTQVADEVQQTLRVRKRGRIAALAKIVDGTPPPEQKKGAPVIRAADLRDWMAKSVLTTNAQSRCADGPSCGSNGDERVPCLIARYTPFVRRNHHTRRTPQGRSGTRFRTSR
jgi:hypothetical protein